MAITLRRFGFYKEAIERSRIAHDLDPDNWRADFCLAQTYALQKDYTTAIQTLSALISAFRSDQDHMREFRDTFYEGFLDYLGEWNSELSQYDAAMAAFREILEKYPENYQIALKLITLLKKQEKFSEIIQFLQDMNKTMNDQGLSRLIAMYHQYADDSTYPETISFAAQQSNSLKVIKDAYQNAVEAAKEDASKLAILIALRYWYGLTLFHDHHFPEDHDESRQPLGAKHCRGGPSSGNSDGNEKEPINEDTPLLLGRLFHLMRQAQQAKECMRGHVRVALDLLSDDDPSNDWQGYQRLALTLAPFDDDGNALAAWSLIGPVEDEKDFIRSKDEDKLVSDPGVANPNGKDETGKDVVADTDSGDTDHVDQINQQDLKLPDGVNTASKAPKEEVKVGIETGAAVADSISDKKDATTPSVASTNEVITSTLVSGTTDSVPTNGAQEESPPSPQPEAAYTPAAPRAKRGMLGQYCDGYCGHTWTFADDMYACKDCIDIQFEPGCLEKLRNGTLERKVCGMGHEFLYVPKWDEDEHAKIPEGKMKVGEELVVVKDWLNAIRRQWGFETVQ